LDTTDQSKWRAWRRKSEIALTVKRILEENGYKDKSLDYYYLHRKYLRKSKKNGFLRFYDLIGNQFFWGYGVKISHPVISFFLSTLFFSIIYTLLPLIDSKSGVSVANSIINVSSPDGQGFLDFLRILYCSILVSSFSVFGSIDIVGYAQLVAVLHVLVSVLLIGLGISTLSKKLANV
jgi:hypothetical protein